MPPQGWRRYSESQLSPLTSLGVWEPLRPEQVATIFDQLAVPWWIAGGLAIDAFLGFKSREHGDVDVSVLRRDQLIVQAAMAGWDLQAVDPPGSLRPWGEGETLPESVHNLWCRPAPDAAWGIELMLEESEGEMWEFRRNVAIRRPVNTLFWWKDDIPYLAPEVQLLYKARELSPKNQSDFDACLPRLRDDQKSWLAYALTLAHPGHPWQELLAQEPGS